MFVNMTGDGFVLVKTKAGKRRNRNINHLNKNLTEKKCVTFTGIKDATLKDLSEDITQVENSMRDSAFLQNIIKVFGSIASSFAIEDVVSYGIGSMSSCKISRYQFGLLMKITEFLRVPKEKVKFYDPCFTKTDEELIEQCGFQAIKFNEEGRRTIASKNTLFYMPHCGRPLYNNVLRSNWCPDKLTRLIIVGNSFQSIVNNIADKQLLKKYPAIHKVHPYMDEYPLPDFCERNDTFNDTSIHLFSKDKFMSCTDLNGFWEIPNDVEYNEEEEIIRNS